MADEAVPDKAAVDKAMGQLLERLAECLRDSLHEDEDATNENERQAAALKAGISSYVGTATLAMLAGGVALFTYVQQNFNVSGVFYGFTAAAGVLLIASFVAGGKGANTTASELAKGTWKKGTNTPAFNVQAILTLLGTVALVVATVVGTSSHRLTTPQDPCVALLLQELAMPNPDLEQLRKELALCEAARS
jgi:hypothetical protein